MAPIGGSKGIVDQNMIYILEGSRAKITMSIILFYQIFGQKKAFA